jgi:hypothetical protein
MKSIFAVTKNLHDAITVCEREFKLPTLPSGNCTITAWHGCQGEQIQ